MRIGDSKLFVMGRLKKPGFPGERRGHSVRARSGDLVLDSSTTDGSGRFLLEWRDAGKREAIKVELLDTRGAVSESTDISSEELCSPPAVVFSGEGVVGAGDSSVHADRMDRFEAEGDYPLCVVSSCQEATLSWNCPQGSSVAILADGVLIQSGLPALGSMKVSENRSVKYTRRVSTPGGGPGQFTDRTVEVRRYPSLSLVLYGMTLWINGIGEIGASISCPAGKDGMNVAVASSDLEMVPNFEIALLPSTDWGTARVNLGAKKGVVTLTGTAEGFARDSVTFTLK
jgi:hypothetical protein